MEQEKDLYEKHKGKKFEYKDSFGVVCGYCTGPDYYRLIGAVTNGEVGWEAEKSVLKKNDHIITNQNNLLGYWYISEDDIID